MSRAVLVAAGSGATAVAGDATVLGRLLGQLRDHAITDVTILARPRYAADISVPGVKVLESADTAADLARLWEMAADDTRPLFLAYADLLASPTTVAAVLEDRSRRSGALCGDLVDGGVAVSRERGMISAIGTGDAGLAGLVKIAAGALPGWRGALAAVPPDTARGPGASGDTLTLAVLALARSGVPVTSYATPGLACARVADSGAAARLLADIESIDEEAWRLHRAVKHDDDLFATYCVSSWSPKLVLLAARLRWTPVAVTWLSIAFAGGAALSFAQGDRPWWIVGALLMYLSFVFDCVDGQLARYTQHFTAFGGWLDMIADRGKEYAVYAGLAAGATSAGLDHAWPIAVAAILTQTARHMADTWYGELQDRIVVAKSSQAGFGTGDADADSSTVRLGQTLGRLSAQVMAAHRSPAYWFKRTIVFPVGERWLVMGGCAAVFDPRVALIVLLSWQLLAVAYTAAGRLLRALAARTPVLDRPDLSWHRDDGPLAAAVPPLLPPIAAMLGAVALLGAAVLIAAEDSGWALVPAAVAWLLGLSGARRRHLGFADWLVPAMLRLTEFGCLIVAAMVAEVPASWVFALLFVIALYFYDLAASLDKAASPLSARGYGLGWGTRVALVLAAATVDVTLDTDVTRWLVLGLAGYIGAVFVIGALAGRARALARAS